MKTFHLPDLGEGLPEAVIREWFIKEGDTVNRDQPMVAVETAKALVEVPTPFPGVIEKLFVNVGETVKTNHAIVGFISEDEDTPALSNRGTVVGVMETSDQVLSESTAHLKKDMTDHTIISPKARAVARRLNLDPAQIPASGTRLTEKDIHQFHKTHNNKTQALSPSRQAMALAMTQAHKNVVATTLSDDADIHSWHDKQDLTCRLIRAICAACQKEPIVNSHFYAESMSYQTFDPVHLGIAIDTQHGLYVPVIKDIHQITDSQLRTQINHYKELAQNKSLTADDLQGATLTLSNFGALSGKYVTPIIIPPMVAIIAAGRAWDNVVAINKKIDIRRHLPLSLSFDHRFITGGEAARFLQALILDLQQDEQAL